MTSADPILSVRDLRVEIPTPRGVVKAVDGVDLEIPRGGAFGLVGESGCGKSLTALSIMRLLPKGGARTIRGAAKRFRLTATGKIKRGHSHARHILTKKTNKRKRLLDIDALVSESDQKRVERMLPYGRD